MQYRSLLLSRFEKICANVVFATLLLKDVRAKFSNIDFFLKLLPLKDEELAMSEM